MKNILYNDGNGKSFVGRRAALASLFLAVAVLGFLPVPTHGATITGVTIEDVSSELVGNFNRAAAYTVDGSGFDEATGVHTVVPDDFMWLNNGVFAGPNDPLPAFITFDLEGNYNLNSVTVWNYNETLPGRDELLKRGANDVEILVAASVGGAFTTLGNFNFDIAPGVDNVDFGQSIDLSGFALAADARLVRFDITSNLGGDNEFVGLSEVRFDGSAVPEPGAPVLMVFSLLGFLGIRRRR